MALAIVGTLAVTLCAIVVAGAVRAGRRAPISSIDTPGLRLSLLCPDCSGSVVAHAAWCGRGERPAHEHDPREVRGGVKRGVEVARC